MDAENDTLTVADKDASLVMQRAAESSVDIVLRLSAGDTRLRLVTPATPIIRCRSSRASATPLPVQSGRQCKAAAFAPLIVFKALAIATNQYYLQGITNQLNIINEKFDTLKEYFEAEQRAKIRAAKVILQELYKIECPNMAHLIRLNSAQQDVLNVREWCKHLLEDISEEKAAAIAAVGKAGFTKLRLDGMRKRFGKSNFMRLFDMASYADNLYHGMKIMEALLNMRMLDTSYNRSGHIEELWRDIEVQG